MCGNEWLKGRGLAKHTHTVKRWRIASSFVFICEGGGGSVGVDGARWEEKDAAGWNGESRACLCCPFLFFFCPLSPHWADLLLIGRLHCCSAAPSPRLKAQGWASTSECIYIYIYTHVCLHLHTHTPRSDDRRDTCVHLCRSTYTLLIVVFGVCCCRCTHWTATFRHHHNNNNNKQSRNVHKKTSLTYLEEVGCWACGWI